MSSTPQRGQFGASHWLSALQVYCKAPVVAMLFLGFSAGLPYLLVFSTLTAWLKDSGVDVAAIGFFSWIGMIYSLKIIGAPLIDRIRLPFLGKLLGQRRSWMLVGQIMIALGLVGLAMTDPLDGLAQVAGFALLTAVGAATQDIVLDAFRIETGATEIQAAMASIYIIGYRFGLVMAGAGALYIADLVAWSAAYYSMAAMVLIGMITILLRPEPIRTHQVKQVMFDKRVRHWLAASTDTPIWRRRMGVWAITALICPFTDFFQRYGKIAITLLIFVGIYRIGDITMAAMSNPLYLTLGFSKSDIASVTKVFGIIMTIVGGLLGGVMVVRYGLAKMLLAGASLVAATNLLFVALALGGHQFWLFVMTIAGDNLANGFASAVFIAFLSSMTSKAYTATQYALFSSLMSLPGKFLGGFSGVVVEHYSYAHFFALNALLGVPAVLLAWWLCRNWRQVMQPAASSTELE